MKCILILCVISCFLGMVKNTKTLCPKVCNCLDDAQHHYNGGVVVNCSAITHFSLEDVLANVSDIVNTLYLDDVNLGSYQKPWPYFPALNKLYVRSAGLRNVSRFLQNLRNTSKPITYMDLSGNQIRHLDYSSFQRVPNLETLNLQRNRIQYLYSDIFQHVPKLLYLYLSDNSIRIIQPNSFSALSNLILLDLTSNQLAWTPTITNVLNGLSSVTELKLQNNSITGLHRDIFLQMPKLQYLHLDHNKLASIPVKSCQGLQKLTALYLTNNLIRDIKTQLSRLSNLQYLYLSGNKIINVHSKSFDGSESLKSVWLNKNNLSRLDQDLMPAFYQIKEINLLDNPWNCDLDLVWLVRWFQNSGNPHSPTCHAPHNGLPWSKLNVRQMRFPINKECGSDSSHSCRYCPPFQYSKNGQHCRCMPGYERSHQSKDCIACQRGAYSDGESPCKECDQNSTTLSKASYFCLCSPGYMLGENNQCIECPANTYKTKYGVYPCVPCPGYSTSPPGSRSSRDCHCLNPASYGNMYGAQICLQLNRDTDSVYISTERHIATVAEDKHKYKGTMLVVFATFCCCSVVIALLVVYIRKYGIHSARREMSRDRGTEIVTLSSSDWLNGFSVNKDGRYFEWDVPIRKVKIGRQLGKGAFGVVNEAMAYGGSGFDSKSFKVAVKRLRDRASEEDVSALKQELEQMKLLGRHPNIISLFGYCCHKGQTMIVMEMAELGDLLTYLKERGANSQNYVSISPDGNISEEETKYITEDRELMSFAWQVAKGMSHIEGLKCIHRDLAARNVLLVEGPVAKISDFGLSRDVYENGYYLRVTKGRLPFKWLSPEALLWGQFSSKGDVWSYGMLLWEIATLGASPYPGIPADRMADLHRSGYRMHQPPNCPNELYKIMRTCWDEDPRKRPTFLKLCDMMENILLAAIDRNYLEIQANPVSNNEWKEESLDMHLEDNEINLTVLGSDESLPCLQRFTDNVKCDGSSGYFSSTTGFYT